MPRIVINRELLFYTVTAPVGSPRLKSSPPPNHPDDVLLIQWFFHKFLTYPRQLVVRGALLDSIAMDGSYGMRTDYLLHYLLVTFATSAVGFIEAFADDGVMTKLRLSGLADSGGHRVKPIKELGFGTEFGDERTMSWMNLVLLRHHPTITVKNPIQPDMPPRLQEVLKANTVVWKGSTGGGAVINAPSA